MHPSVLTYLYESDVRPLVAAADLVEGEEVRTRSLQELWVELVTDVIDNDNGRFPDERLLSWIEAENRPVSGPTGTENYANGYTGERG